MKADNIKPLLVKLISYSIFFEFLKFGPLSEESSNFRKVLLVFLGLKKFSFQLPIVLKTDFEKKITLFNVA